MSDEDLLDFDFIEEVKETKKHIEEVEKRTDKAVTNSNILVTKLDKISKNFDIATTEVEEMTTEVATEVAEIKSKSLANISPSDMFQLDILYSDFTTIRNTLTDTVTKGKLVIDTLTVELTVAPDNAELVASYSQLISVVNSSMKLLGTTYKDITEVISRIKKFEENNKDENTSGGVTNIQNNFYAENVNDIIALVRGKKD